jgi:hypothetical protein
MRLQSIGMGVVSGRGCWQGCEVLLAELERYRAGEEYRRLEVFIDQPRTFVSTPWTQTRYDD